MLPVYINEIYPDPPVNQKEWVEIINLSEFTVDLTGFNIRDSTNHHFHLDSFLGPQEIKTFENPTSFINNTSADDISLVDSGGNVIDSRPSKPLPDHQSFSRQNDGSWCLTEISPNKANSPCLSEIIPTPKITPTVIPAEAGTYINLEITEILANPDDGDEWIKIYNPNSFSVDLADWRVKDQSGNSRKITCTQVDALSTCQAFFSSGYLNNDGDTVYLLDSQKRIITSYSYSIPPKATSTKKPTVTPKPTVTKKPTSIKSSAAVNCPPVLGITFPPIASRSSGLTIKESNSPIMIFSTILMIGGTILILSPLLFHGSKNKNK